MLWGWGCTDTQPVAWSPSGSCMAICAISGDPHLQGTSLSNRAALGIPSVLKTGPFRPSPPQLLPYLLSHRGDTGGCWSWVGPSPDTHSLLCPAALSSMSGTAEFRVLLVPSILPKDRERLPFLCVLVSKTPQGCSQRPRLFPESR